MTVFWYIQLLGDLSVCSAQEQKNIDKVFRFRWQKVGALLARLAWRPGERVSREVLITLLWPDDAPEKGRENLRAALASLRRQLEPPGIPAGCILVAHGRTHLSLNPDAIETDAALFEQQYRQGRYTEALAVYRGPFLPDIYDDWALTERMRLEELAEEAHAKAPRNQEIVQPVKTPAPDTPASSPVEVRLPLRLTRFFGRERELAELTERLETERLVTLTGAGGMGKTRLAIEVAERVALQNVPGFGSVCFIPLADVQNVQVIPAQVATGISVTGQSRIETLEQLTDLLNSRYTTPFLLIMDNFEQFTDTEHGPLFVRGLLEAVPALTLFITSRHRLGLEGEREYPLTEMDVPRFIGSPERLMDFPSVRLYVDRARAFRPDFSVTPRNAKAVGELVERLEGVPLALELAATWSKTYSPARILAEIVRRYDLVRAQRSDLPARQASLRATLEWSLSLLTPELRTLLTRLTVFRGGCTPDAAAEVCEEPNAPLLLTQLRERSLLYSEEVGDTIRFRMLESLRDLLSEDLAREKYSITHHRLLLWLHRYLKETSLNFSGPSQKTWFEIWGQERFNVLRALDFFFEQKDRTDEMSVTVLVISTLYAIYWGNHGLIPEGKRYLDRVLSATDHLSPSSERASGFLWRGNLANSMGENTGSYEDYKESLRIARIVSDERIMAQSLGSLAMIFTIRREYQEAENYIEACVTLFRKIGDERTVGRNLIIRGVIHMEQGQYPESLSCYVEAASIARDYQSLNDLGLILNNISNVYDELDQPDRALQYCEEAVETFEKSGNTLGYAIGLANLASKYIVYGRYTEARKRLENLLVVASETDGSVAQFRFVRVVANLATTVEAYPEAITLVSAVRKRQSETQMFDSPQQQEKEDKAMINLSAKLNEKVFRKYWQTGEEMAWAEAVDYAQNYLVEFDSQEKLMAPT